MVIQRGLLAVMLVVATRSTAAVRIEPGLGFRTEPGVETKEFLSAGVTATAPFGGFWGSIAFSAGDNPGIAYYGIGAEARLVKLGQLRLRGQVNHNQWSSWQVGENSISCMVLAAPLRLLELGAGLAWRAPQLPPAGYASPFRFTGQANEWNLLYRLQLPLLARRNAGLALWIADDDPLNPHTAQEFPFGVAAWRTVGRRWRVTGRLGSGIKGLSGALLSLGELEARIGVSYCRD